uniref:Putative transcription factor ap-1 n=1 Tax=Rhipicephalus microplus TaxID=6941 RepID=A0A6M2D3T3_RHIMP
MLQQYATFGSNMSDLSDPASNYSSFLLSSSKHLVMGVSEEDKPQTVYGPGCTSLLSSVGLDENNSDDTSEQPTATHQLEQSSSNDEFRSRKLSMTLDLYSPGAFRNGHKEAHCSSLLPSPVLQMLLVSTPELEQFITFNGQDPMVNGLFSLTETEEEEGYPIDFFESLEQLQSQPQQPAPQQHTTSGSDTSDSTSNDSSFLSSSSEHMVMGVFDMDKPQTLHCLDCTAPLSCVGLDENNSNDTNEQPTAAHQPAQQQQTSSNDEFSSRKRSMTLDLYSPRACRHGHKVHSSSLLPSPVLQMLVLSTPELEQFITFNGRDLMVNELFALTET